MAARWAPEGPADSLVPTAGGKLDYLERRASALLSRGDRQGRPRHCVQGLRRDWSQSMMKVRRHMGGGVDVRTGSGGGATSWLQVLERHLVACGCCCRRGRAASAASLLPGRNSKLFNSTHPSIFYHCLSCSQGRSCLRVKAATSDP